MGCEQFSNCKVGHVTVKFEYRCPIGFTQPREDKIRSSEIRLSKLTVRDRVTVTMWSALISASNGSNMSLFEAYNLSFGININILYIYFGLYFNLSKSIVFLGMGLL